MAQQVAQLAPRAQPEEFACTSPVELQLQQLIPYILCRPIDPKIVKRIRQSLGELGFLYDAGKLSCVLLTGNPGDANATYGLVNGHHRHSALTQEKAAGNPKLAGFTVRCFPPLRARGRRTVLPARTRGCFAFLSLAHVNPSPFPLHSSTTRARAATSWCTL
jgi:hypothetical protein